jgi:uncharacterized protein
VPNPATKLFCGVLVLFLSNLISVDRAVAQVVEGNGQGSGEAELKMVLASRPQLEAIVEEGNPIWNWLVSSLNGPSDVRIRWSSDSTSGEIPVGAQSSTYPDGKGEVVIHVDGVYKSGLKAHQLRPAEEVLNNLVFELNNIHRGPEKKRLTLLAETGGISRDEFVRGIFEEEYSAQKETCDFYAKIWMPYCLSHKILPNPSIWGWPCENDINAAFAKYPKSFWYPWKLYGSSYDTLAADSDEDFVYDPSRKFNANSLMAAATAGDAASQEKLGVLYINGEGVGQSYEAAFTEFLNAASQGDALAAEHLSWMYDWGVGTVKDDVKSREWEEKAAQHGNIVALRNMGIRYQQGLGVPINLEQAVAYFRSAAQKGDCDANDRLGYALLEGKGVPKDPAEGFRCLLLAAHRNGHARLAIAQCYKNGVYVSRDPVQAYKWCLIALQRDQQAYTLAEELKAQLTDAQRQEAERDAQAWISSLAAGDQAANSQTEIK